MSPIKFAQFTVLRASANRNSFGLREYWLLAKDNRVFIACNSADHKVFDEVSTQATPNGAPAWELCRLHGTVKDRAKFLEHVKECQYKDGEVIGRESSGALVFWNASTQTPYTSGETLAEYGVENLTKRERTLLGVQP